MIMGSLSKKNDDINKFKQSNTVFFISIKIVVLNERSIS